MLLRARFGSPVALSLAATLWVLCVAPVIDAADVSVDSAVPTITFDDSDSAGGPEWLVRTTNDSQFFNIFSYNGAAADTNPVRVSAGCPDDSLHVSVDPSGGANVGIGGVADEYTELQIQASQRPRLRFYETFSAPYRWDVEASSQGFFITDNTAFNATPFRIQPATPTSTLYLEPDSGGLGEVGVGTGDPQYPLHVVRTTDSAARLAQFTQTKANGVMLVGYENDAASSLTNEAGFDFVLRTSNTTRRVCARLIAGYADNNDASRTGQFRFLAANNGVFAEAFRVKGNRVGVNQPNPTTVLQVVNATCNGTTWADASSRTLKQDIADLPADSAREVVMGLNPVSYTYRQDPSDQRWGFIAEDVPAAVAMPGRETLASLDIIAAMAKVMQEQDHELAAQRAVIESLAARLAAIESREE